MNSFNSQDIPNDSIDSEPVSESPRDGARTNDSMEEYYILKKSVFLVTLLMTGILFLVVWITFSLNIALSYLIGACVGIVYLRMLAKDVEKINSDNRRVSSGRLAIFAGMIILATRLEQLSVFPVFLGFLTYKLAIIGYVLITSLKPTQNQNPNHSQ